MGVAVIARRPHGHVGPGDSLVQLQLDMRGLDGVPASGQTFVQTVKAPDIAGCWQGPA